MTNLSKQDVQSVVDNAKNQMLQRVVTKQDIQVQNDLLKVVIVNLQQCQQIVRQSEYQRVQMTRNISALEGRTMQMDQELRQLRATLDRLIEHQPERIMLPAQPEQARTPEQRYLYNPSA